MRIVKAFFSSLIGGFVGVLAAMLVTKLFEPHAFKLWEAIGISFGLAIANAIREWRQVSSEKFAWLLGCCAALGGIIGAWFAGPG
jgi:uncharacterized membrane protein YfcA